MKGNEEFDRNMGGTDGAEETVPLSEQIQEIPEQEIERLKGELEAKKKEAEENNQKFLRAYADLENYRKRAEKEKADCIAYANESLIEGVLPVIDNFERALSHASEESLESLIKGVKLTVDQMFVVLKKYGLQEIKALGEKFDPSIHHAISHEETTQAEPETIVKEFQKGYYLKARLLRPAMVAVAKAPETGGPH